MSDVDRMEKQFDFIKLIDGEKLISRQNYITGGERRENDAEHSWHMAVMAMLLSEYASEEIDVLKTIEIILVHDLVEIEAGDTYAYDEEAGRTQRERETAAADSIFSVLPDDQASWMRSLWDEFEERRTPEAKFARTMDCIQPLMLNSETDGKAWREHGVKLSQVMERNSRTYEGSEALWKYALTSYIDPGVEKGNLKNE